MTSHFHHVLNNRRGGVDQVVDSSPGFDITVDWSVPTLDDVMKSAMHLKRNKAPDLTGVHAELIQACVKGKYGGMEDEA